MFQQEEYIFKSVTVRKCVKFVKNKISLTNKNISSISYHPHWSDLNLT